MDAYRQFSRKFEYDNINNLLLYFIKQSFSVQSVTHPFPLMGLWKKKCDELTSVDAATRKREILEYAVVRASGLPRIPPDPQRATVFELPIRSAVQTFCWRSNILLDFDIFWKREKTTSKLFVILYYKKWSIQGEKKSYYLTQLCSESVDGKCHLNT